MTTFTVKFNVDTAAFDGPTDHRNRVIADVLRDVADGIQNSTNWAPGFTVFDDNSNSIGKVEITK